MVSVHRNVYSIRQWRRVCRLRKGHEASVQSGLYAALPDLLVVIKESVPRNSCGLSLVREYLRRWWRVWGLARRVPQNAHLGEFDSTRSLEMPLVISCHRLNVNLILTTIVFLYPTINWRESSAINILRLRLTIRNVRYTILNDAQHTYNRRRWLD
jgi:hypothetical protein